MSHQCDGVALSPYLFLYDYTDGLSRYYIVQNTDYKRSYVINLSLMGSVNITTSMAGEMKLTRTVPPSSLSLLCISTPLKNTMYRFAHRLEYFAAGHIVPFPDLDNIHISISQ